MVSSEKIRICFSFSDAGCKRIWSTRCRKASVLVSDDPEKQLRRSSKVVSNSTILAVELTAHMSICTGHASVYTLSRVGRIRVRIWSPFWISAAIRESLASEGGLSAFTQTTRTVQHKLYSCMSLARSPIFAVWLLDIVALTLCRICNICFSSASTLV